MLVDLVSGGTSRTLMVDVEPLEEKLIKHREEIQKVELLEEVKGLDQILVLQSK